MVGYRKSNLAYWVVGEMVSRLTVNQLFLVRVQDFPLKLINMNPLFILLLLYIGSIVLIFAMSYLIWIGDKKSKGSTFGDLELYMEYHLDCPYFLVFFPGVNLICIVTLIGKCLTNVKIRK